MVTLGEIQGTPKSVLIIDLFDELGTPLQWIVGPLEMSVKNSEVRDKPGFYGFTFLGRLAYKQPSG